MFVRLNGRYSGKEAFSMYLKQSIIQVEFWKSVAVGVTWYKSLHKEKALSPFQDSSNRPSCASDCVTSILNTDYIERERQREEKLHGGVMTLFPCNGNIRIKTNYRPRTMFVCSNLGWVITFCLYVTSFTKQLLPPVALTYLDSTWIIGYK